MSQNESCPDGCLIVLCVFLLLDEHVEGKVSLALGQHCAGAHVSCATGQESTVCLSMRLGSFLFDSFCTPFHIYQSLLHH
jgi:hypothetical protein